MTHADASVLTLGNIAWLASLGSIFAGCVLLHVRLRKRASFSLLASLAAAVLWFAAGQSMVYDFLAPPHIPSPPTEGPGNNAQAALDAMGDHAPAANAMIVGDALLLLWIALSFVLAVASVRSRTSDPTKPEDGSPR